MSNIIPINATRAAKLRAVAESAFVVGEQITGDEELATRISAMAVRRYSSGTCSPAMALAIARTEARSIKQGDTA